MKSVMNEFKQFIMRGNVLDMAVGVIIGGAFQKIISSMVNDIIMPIVSLVTGGVDFSNWFITLDGKHYATLQEATAAGAATINYGTFLTQVIDFILMAFVIFMIVKIMNHLADRVKKPIEKEAPKTKKCPYCMSDIHIEATKCPHCTSQINE